MEEISKTDVSALQAGLKPGAVPILQKQPQQSSFTALHRLFELQAERTPDAIAVWSPPQTGGGVFFSGSHWGQDVLNPCGQLTYRELNERANQLAQYLQEHGAGADTLVGIFAERSIAMVVAVLATLKAGSAYVPLDPAYPEERLTFMLDDTQAPIVLTHERLAGRLPKGKKYVICLDRDDQFIGEQRTDNLPVQAGKDNLAYLIYTSGSTGQPKGVAMRQEPLVNLLEWQLKNWSFPSPARTLQFASLNFDVSFQEIFSTWCSGGCLVLIDENIRRDSRALLQFVSANRIQRVFLPFIALKHLAEIAVAETTLPQDLREVITAGEQLQITPALIEFFSRLKGCTLENQYGPSETHVVTSYRLDGDPRDWPVLPPIGKPVTNAQVLLLNEQLEATPGGEPGEIYLGGACLARGYLNREELTCAKFVRNPFGSTSQDRLYRTGDLGRLLSDGNIEFLGRLDHQVKVAGVRVELGEIEAALHLYPEVKEAIVVARDFGGDKRLVAYIVPQPESKLSSAELRNFLRRKLPAFLVPPVFVRLDSLPLTPNGKVDRRALPEITEPEEDFSVPVKTPQTPLQMSLQLVFERFLNRRPIGTDVSFFELGGDSLQALNLIIEVERVTRKKLPMGILYQAPTIESLAKILEQDGAEWSSLVPLQPLGRKPPLFLVHSMPGDVLGYGGVVYHLGTDQPCYGLQSLAFHSPSEAHTRVEAMASYYLKLMRTHQEHGPYYLGGWCYGGIIAVEMAHQLRAAGEEIAFLGLIETPAPAPDWSHVGYFLRRMSCLFRMQPKAWRSYLVEKFKYYRGLKKANQLRFRRLEQTDGRSASEVEETNRYLDRLEFVYGVNRAALRFYKSRYYPGKVTLFNAAEQDPALLHDPRYGWGGLADVIETHVIPGNHATILAEPQVRVLAGRITECLQRIGSEADRFSG